MDYIYVMGDVTSFQGSLQLNVKRVKKMAESDVNPADYLPVSEYNIEEMYQKLSGIYRSDETSISQAAGRIIFQGCGLCKTFSVPFRGKKCAPMDL